MRVSHVALASSSEEKADRFYQGVLGLKKTRTVTLPASIMKAIFGLDEECKKTDYEDVGIRFEIFFTGQEGARTIRPDHVCLEVHDVETFLKKCEAMKVEIIRVAKGESVVIFIKDYDSNFFEIKEKKQGKKRSICLGYDWNTMNRLFEKGFISDPVGKSKPVAVTTKGCKEAKESFEKHFLKSRAWKRLE